MDLRPRLTATTAVGSLAVHLADVAGHGRGASTQTLCGLPVTDLSPFVTDVPIGCSDCGLHALEMGVEVAREADGGLVRMDRVRFD